MWYWDFRCFWNLKETLSDICHKLFEPFFCVCECVAKISFDMVLGTYSCSILSSLWFFTGWINGFLKFYRVFRTHAHWVTENFWVWFYTRMVTFSMQKHIGSSCRAFLAIRAARFSLCFLLNNTGRLLSSILSGKKYSPISPQTHDAFFLDLLPFYKMENWRWEAVVASNLEKKSVQNHHKSFWDLLAHLRD